MIGGLPGVTSFDMPSDREIVVRRVFKASRTVVWDAWTRPERVRRWMLDRQGATMPICEIDLQPGGKYRFIWSEPDGTELDTDGEFREVVPPERLVSAESWGRGWIDILKTLLLAEKNGRTMLSCTLQFHSGQARSEALEGGIRESWSASLNRLDEYLQEPPG